MNEYVALKKKHEKEVHEFPMFFALSNEAFADGMNSLGLSVNDKDKILKTHIGGFMRKSDYPAYKEMLVRHDKERKEAVKNDRTGTGFIYWMFYTELVNREYSYTGDYEEALECLGISMEEIEADKALKRGFDKAIKAASAADPF